MFLAWCVVPGTASLQASWEKSQGLEDPASLVAQGQRDCLLSHVGSSFSLHFPTGTSGLQSSVTPAQLSWGRAFLRPGLLAPSSFTGGGAVLYPVGSLTEAVALPTEIASKLSLDFSVCPWEGSTCPRG